MKPYTKNLHGRNHRYSTPENKRVPKSASERVGTRTEKRQENDKAVKDVLNEVDWCKSCGGFINYDKSKVLYSYPLQYNGNCSCCGKHTTAFCHEVD